MKSDPFSLFQAVWPHPMSREAHLRRIGALLDEEYEYYRVQLAPHVRCMYAAELGHLDCDVVDLAIKQHRGMAAPANQTKKPPMPHDLLRLINPQPSVAERAHMMASSIWAAIASPGKSYNSAQIRAHLGDEAFNVVERLGGWQHLCRTEEADNVHVFLPQTRALCEAVIQNAAQMQRAQKYKALLAKKVQLSQDDRARPLASMGEILGRLPYAMQNVSRGA